MNTVMKQIGKTLPAVSLIDIGSMGPIHLMPSTSLFGSAAARKALGYVCSCSCSALCPTYTATTLSQRFVPYTPTTLSHILHVAQQLDAPAWADRAACLALSFPDGRRHLID